MLTGNSFKPRPKSNALGTAGFFMTMVYQQKFMDASTPKTFLIRENKIN